MTPVWGRICACLIVGAVLTLAHAGAAQAAGYPDPPPDFAHPAAGHFPRWTPASGANSLPLLVIYMEFSDVAFPAALDAAGLARRAFGGFPSIADYWAKQSSGRFALTPAREADASGEGRVDDGVVRVRIELTKAQFLAQAEGMESLIALHAADPAVDFASFDRDGDARLTNDELAIVRVEADTAALPAGDAATRAVGPFTLDAMALEDLRIAQISTATNLISAIHETWHVLFVPRDFYGFGVGWFDIAAPALGAPDTSLVAMAAWNKLHLGWSNPTVVTRDGYRELGEAGDVSSDAAILYDPDRGTDDYFIVENRRRRPGSYDQSVPDSGLLIWRIDERHYASADDFVRPVEIVRPDGQTPDGCNAGCYGGNDSDAWDPADARTPQRTMDRPWRDGSPAGVAVRAIGNAGERMRAYFDVRGPGVLVDPYALNVAGPVALQTGRPNQLHVPVMNTGEAADTFEFALAGLPAGWSSTGTSLTLAAGTRATATISITPTAAAPPVALTVTGRSTSDGAVASHAPFVVSVLESRANLRPPPFTVTLDGAARQRVMRRNRLTLDAHCNRGCLLEARADVAVRKRGRTYRFRDRTFRSKDGRSFGGVTSKIVVSLTRPNLRRIRRELRARRRVDVRVSVTAIANGDQRRRASRQIRIVG